jgi:hypothetical protein
MLLIAQVRQCLWSLLALMLVEWRWEAITRADAELSSVRCELTRLSQRLVQLTGQPNASLHLAIEYSVSTLQARAKLCGCSFLLIPEV